MELCDLQLDAKEGNRIYFRLEVVLVATPCFRRILRHFLGIVKRMVDQIEFGPLFFWEVYLAFIMPKGITFSLSVPKRNVNVVFSLQDSEVLSTRTTKSGLALRIPRTLQIQRRYDPVLRWVDGRSFYFFQPTEIYS